MVIAALEDQQQVREILALERLGETIHWVSIEDAQNINSPLVATGQWAISHPEPAKSIFTARMRAGLGSLLIPRFQPGDLAQVLGAPSAIEAAPAETEVLIWDTIHYQVPGSVVFRTKLHVGQWAVVPGVGVQLLAFRPTTTRGWVILCGVSISSQRPGVNVEDQLALWQALLKACAPKEGTARKGVGSQSEAALLHDQTALGKLSPSDLLIAYPKAGPGLLMSLLTGAPADSSMEIVAQARKIVGVLLEQEEVSLIIPRLQGSIDEIEAALVTSGWGPFLRKVKQRCWEAEDDG